MIQRNFLLMLQREPAAFGSLIASILPVLVLVRVIRIDEAGIAAVVLAINTVVGFGIRVLVSPTTAPVSRSARPRRRRAAATR